MNKILIIKLGYSETLASFLHLDCSLGDVLRTTFILHYFKDDEISWLVDYKAVPLLEDNEFIGRILVCKPLVIEKLKKESFDTVINFEKMPEICQLAASIQAKHYFGFRFNDQGNNLEGNKDLIQISKDVRKKRENRFSWQEILARSVNKQWNKEPYILGYKPGSDVIHDIGFNWTTSDKWKNKSWPGKYWEELENIIENRYSVSWQQGIGNLYDYMEWINSCSLIVTADSLGLHLALALKKRVIALFGPTSPHEIYFYGLGSYITPDIDYDCIPCINLKCAKEKMCMENILPDKVAEKIDYEFEKIRIASQL